MLAGLDAPWAPVQAVEELLDDPQVLANDYLGEVDARRRPSYRLPDVPVQFDERPAGAAPRARSTASTPSWSCSSSGTRGTTSARCRPQA